MKNVLEEACPFLARERSIKNLPLTARDVTTGSHKRVWWKGTCGHEWQAIIKNRVDGSGCPYCSGHKILKGFNDLATMKPELVSEWSEKNGSLKPDMVLSCTNKEVWWKCIHGHEWTARVADRYYGSTCPYCSGHKLMKGFNDMESRYPAVAAEWSDRNFPKRPDEVFPRSREKVWWKCHICGHEWKAVIDSRVKGSECPVCSERWVKAGINDLGTTDPGILDEWDYERNQAVSPVEISRYSLRPVWWICPKGHKWRAKIADRVLDQEICHICRKTFEKEFPDLLLRYYVEQAGYEVITNEEELIGIPLSSYIPEKNAVIEISKPEYNSKSGYKWEYVKTDLCRKARIKLIRILRRSDRGFEGCVNIIRLDKSDEALAEAVTCALEILKIDVKPDVKSDREYLLRKFLED